MAKAQIIIHALLLLMAAAAMVDVEAVAFCNINDAGVEACKPAVRKSNPTRPTPACCAALAKADTRCLCSYKGSMMVSFMDVDVDRAMKVPAMCGIRSAPSKC